MTFRITTILISILVFVSCSSAPKKIKDAPKKKTVKVIPLEAQAECRARVKYFRLLANIGTPGKSLKFLKNKTSKQLCNKYYKRTISLIGKHSGKIGILYEDSPKNAQKSKAILQGIASSSSKFKGKKSPFVVAKVKIKKKEVNDALAKLVLKKKVGLIISWGDKKLLNHIQRWQKGLNLPTIFIDNKIKAKKNSFSVFPNRSNYKTKLVESMKAKGVKRIAVLTPAHYKGSPLLKGIKAALKKNGIQIVHDVQYDSHNYASMDFACKKIFTIDNHLRRGELNQIRRFERRKAAAQGFQLNTKHVFLPARVNYDAVLIPDNFKIVHHFVKLFQYYKAPKMPLFGTYEWRSDELVKVGESYLAGSTFVDFIGNPADLPIFSKRKVRKNIRQELGLALDYQVMGFYSGLLSQIAMKTSKKKRVRVSKHLKKIKIKDNFLPRQRAFKNNKLNWPSFSFELSRDEIRLKKKRRKPKITRKYP